MSEKFQDLRASGSARLSGGRYRDVDVSGSAHITGDVECDNFSVSGSARVAGGVTCARFKASGSARVEDGVRAEEMRVSGSAVVDGNVDAGELHSSGSFSTEGDATVRGEVQASGSAGFGGALKARAIRASGNLRVNRGIECETLAIQGVFDVDGLINAGVADIELVGQSHLDEIGGERITIRRRAGFSVLGFQSPCLTGSLDAGVIEATSVYLEATRAKVVRGEEVSIGSGCEIDRVEYSKDLTVAEDSVVRERVRVE